MRTRWDSSSIVCVAFLAFDGDFGLVGEAVLQAELLAQQPVNAFDDVGDDRFGGVIDAAQFAQLGVVGGKEGFVEMDDGITPPARADAFAEVLQDGAHVGAIEQRDDVLHKANERSRLQLWPR